MFIPLFLMLLPCKNMEHAFCPEPDAAAGRGVARRKRRAVEALILGIMWGCGATSPGGRQGRSETTGLRPAPVPPNPKIRLKSCGVS